MPQLVDGRWVKDDVAASEMKSGAFHREPTRFRRWITADGGPVDPALLPPDLAGRTIETLPAEAGRYRLYVAKICPWASRTLIWRALEGLDAAIAITVADPELGDDGWSFLDADGRSRDPAEGIAHLHQLYVIADPTYTGKVSVPVLWDEKTRTIVNNESADIVRMLDGAFDAFAAHPVDLYPVAHRAAIEAWNARIYDTLNNGVYRAGFARSQAAYEAAFDDVFATLDALEAHLSTRRFLVAERPLEADWRLFVTLVRFDAAYYGLFKCNLRRIADYPALSGYLRDLHQWPGVAATVSIDAIKRGYWSIRHLNPTGIVPKGPALDLDGPHGRAALAG
ncbi:glutathione S-transferase family protein [Pinisolibacter aquiterrae]|uniref:glutathione S-transferase family protein n=1 Tax=Pinisolibacter aquiterrae TaxID=2815579 RepID=UPI001C3CF7D2|nr:glutathione S-transferase family protein [Pinisolibacter aquiterrae]MBV5263135.1 glutathione S-transferase family protein [Pinisolibacter aquiterrae]MCC8234049.1 glutathione S-transferase family protein [Pinisolibacter aquiterrae]